MTEKLETKVETESSKQPRNVKRFLLDTFATVSFGFAVGGTIKLANGLSVKQAAVSCLGDMALNFALGGTYGIYRDYVFNRFGVDKDAGFLRTLVPNTYAMNVFWVIPSILSLYATGIATHEDLAKLDYHLKALHTMGSAIVLTPIMAPASGFYMDRLRALFGMREDKSVQVATNNSA